MSDTVLLIVLIVLAFAGGHLVTRFAARHGMLSGAESLLVGIAIGPVGAGLLDGRSLDKAQLLMALLLGLVGFITGMRARRLAPHPEAVVVGLATAICIATGMALFALGWMYQFGDATGPWLVDVELWTWGGITLELRATSAQLESAIVLGAAAAATSSLVIESTAKMYGAQGPLHQLFVGAAVTGEIFAIFLLGLALAIRRNEDYWGRLPLGITEWALLGMGVGVICGLLFAWFARDEVEPKRIFVASTGTVVFAAGVGSAIGLSPTFVNLLAGLTVALVSPKAPAVAQSLERLQHPIQVMVMVFAGMLLAVPSGAEWLLAALYPFVRWGLLRAVVPLASTSLLERPIRAARMGNGMLAQGALPVVIAVAYVARAPEMASIVLTAVLVATVTSDLLSIRALADVLLDAGEIADTTGTRHGVPLALIGGERSKRHSADTLTHLGGQP
jgi:hypothetical protein